MVNTTKVNEHETITAEMERMPFSDTINPRKWRGFEKNAETEEEEILKRAERIQARKADERSKARREYVANIPTNAWQSLSRFSRRVRAACVAAVGAAVTTWLAGCAPVASSPAHLVHFAPFDAPDHIPGMIATCYPDECWETDCSDWPDACLPSKRWELLPELIVVAQERSR